MIDEIINLENGASFCRSDLHIHSFGETGSYDVQDERMNPENIIDTAINLGLQAISITDHNSIGNVERAINYSKGKKILVIPGVELSTPDGHLLMYFPSFFNLQSFYGKLYISPNRQMCEEGMKKCLSVAETYEGIGIAAHIDDDGGLDIKIPGYSPFKESILTCSNLLALEIKNKEHVDWYSGNDKDAHRQQLLKARSKENIELYQFEIPKVLFSDAHNIESLGRNISGNKKITRFKMDELSFQSFKIALMDFSARIRIEELIPESFPYFVGMKLDGGFLRGQTIKFSRNLTCIIGGRGTGKSTMIESLRAASGNEARKNLIDTEVWPDRIALIWEDQTGRQQLLVKDKNCDVTNASNPAGICNIPIESYGQGETADTIQHCDKDPFILLPFLDSFITFDDLINEEKEILEELLTNQTTIERQILAIQQ